MFLKNINLTLGNSLRAIKDVLYPVLISVFSMWLIGTGLAWILGIVFPFGLVGFFCAFFIDEGIRSLLLFGRCKVMFSRTSFHKGWDSKRSIHHPLLYIQKSFVGCIFLKLHDHLLLTEPEWGGNIRPMTFLAGENCGMPFLWVDWWSLVFRSVSVVRFVIFSMAVFSECP